MHAVSSVNLIVKVDVSVIAVVVLDVKAAVVVV